MYGYVHRCAHGHAYDMRMDMRMDMCMDMCGDMRIDMCKDMGRLGSTAVGGPATGTSACTRGHSLPVP